MDKSAVKKYAVWARRELISRVAQKAMKYGISEDNIDSADAGSIGGTVLSDKEKRQRKALVEQIKRKGYEQVMEEVAYTWFNRFMALRFMEVNGYLPSKVRVFTDENNEFKPQILAEAIHMDLDGLDMNKVYELKDTNQQDELYKYLLIVQCNALNSVLPGMFQKLEDYSELLFPDNLLREGSVVEQMIAIIPEEDWKEAVQIIGWLYQYYNSEKKDEVFAALKKNVKITKENIPAATQLFTPDWIVRYMVENSLGRLWVEGHPDEEIKKNWKYYLEEAEQEPEVQVQLAEIRKEYAKLKPEDIKCIDPCMGSGHILAYMFDVLVQIYEAYGYSSRDAAASIVQNNIFGLDIDDRAAQLAYFAVMMKACQYDKRFLNRGIQPNVFAICESNNINRDAVDYFCDGNSKLKADIDTLLRELTDAKEYGSILNVSMVDFDAIEKRIAEVENEIHLSSFAVMNELVPLIKVAKNLAQKYEVVVTNPPYMGASGMSAKLVNYLKDYYSSGKSDFAMVFITSAINMTKQYAYTSLVTPQSWMFLVAFMELRNELIHRDCISSLIHLGTGAFDAGFGTTAFVIRKLNSDLYKGKYYDLRSGVDSNEKIEMLLNPTNCVISSREKFSALPNYVIAYWCSNEVRALFTDHKQVRNDFSLECGIKNGNNDLFLKLWHEVEYNKINKSDDRSECMMALANEKKWFKCNKGGGYRKWYGNYEYVLNLENDAADIKAIIPASTYRLRKKENYFWPTITWPLVSGTKYGCRYMDVDTLPDVNANIILIRGRKEYCLMGYMNSKVFDMVLDMLNPSLAFPIDTISSAPYLDVDTVEVERLVKENIKLTREDWQLSETTWAFLKHPLV